ncbi:MAG: hypothetical protein O7G84_13670 [Gammaproteobacteria bacterium]|nr:hypothetical protein [Gammaproteobacteria bacterium]
MTTQKGSGLFSAMLDAIHGSDEKLGGQAVTQLRVALEPGATEILVISTIGFGEFEDGTGDARVVVGSEIISCSARTNDTFTIDERGIDSTIIQPRYPTNSVVFDESRNTSALDLTRRGMLVNFAIGADLDVVGRNLGVEKCPGLTDSIWRDIIKSVAYLAKQPLGAIQIALEALLGPAGFVLFERTVSSPNRFFVEVVTAPTPSLQGKFFLNYGEPQVVQAGGIVDVTFPITGVPFDGAPAIGNIRVVSGSALVDGEVFVLDDGTNPAVTYEFDDNGSVIPSPTLRAVAFTATSSEEDVRDAIVAAIAGTPTLDITGALLGIQNVTLTHQSPLASGNVAVTTTVAAPLFVVTGMAGGEDPGTIGVTGVFLDIPSSREGLRDGLTNFFTGGSFVGSQITLGTDPGPGTLVIVDYNAHPAHYVAPIAFVNDGTDFPPYFSDNLLGAQCLLDQVRAAGVGVELSAKI